MSEDATADADTPWSRSLRLIDTDSNSGGDDEQGVAVDVPLAAAPGQGATDTPAAGKAVAPTAGKVVPWLHVQNKYLKGLLMINQDPWVVNLLNGRTVSPSEFERLAGSPRKNWKLSTFVLQPDGSTGMNVGHWMDTKGIQNPAKTKGSAPRAPARPSQPAQTRAAKQTAAPGTPAKRENLQGGKIGKAPDPKMHLDRLSALLESHGKKLEGWTVGYTGTRADPYYCAPEGFVPDMAELPPSFTGNRYPSRIRVAQAHGIPAATARKSRASAKSHDASARSGGRYAKPRAAVVRKRAPVTVGTAAFDSDSADDDEDDDNQNKELEACKDDKPPAKRTRTAAAAQPILSGVTAAPSGPLTPSTQTQKAGAQGLLQLRAVDQAVPKTALAPASVTAGRAASSSQQAAVRDLFTRVQTFINIVEIDADSLEPKHIRRYMDQAKAGLKELMERFSSEGAEFGVNE